MAPIRVLIVDDEPVARRTIRLLLQNDPSIEVVGECSNGKDVITFVRGASVDLMFLDVQMPGMGGFDILTSLNPDTLPAIIFVTAYDKYAIRAFEVQSLDYLLKPFDDQRFYQALGRAKKQIIQRDVSDVSKELGALLEEFKQQKHSAPSKQQKGYISRLMVRSTGRVVMVPVDEIDWIEAEGDYASLVVQGKKHLLREKFGELERQLDPAFFVRIHRSYIVRIDCIKELKPQLNGDYRVILRDAMQLPLSRTYREHVLSLLQKSP